MVWIQRLCFVLILIGANWWNIAFAIDKADAAPLEGAIVTSVIDENLTGATYDYIIAGGGTAGLVIARRLAESPGAPRVLVIEAGDDTRNNPLVVGITEDYGTIF